MRVRDIILLFVREKEKAVPKRYSSDCRKSMLLNMLLLYHSALAVIVRLPIVLFVGKHFSGSLFEWVHLSI